MAPRELLTLLPSREADPAGLMLRAALDAHLEYERRRATRELLVFLLVALSALVWPAAAWPRWYPGVLRRFALGAWAVCFAGLWLAWIGELRWLRRRDRAAAILAPADVVSGGEGRAIPGEADGGRRA